MSLGLTSRSSYALRAMLHLTRTRDAGLQKARRIAEETAIPAAYLPQVLGALIRHDLVTSHAGPRGGYALACDPSAVSVLAVVEAVDGPLVSGVCALRGGPCTPGDACSMHERWRDAQAALTTQLADCSLADLFAKSEEADAPGPALLGERP